MSRTKVAATPERSSALCDDDGFTLLELLITALILPLIMGAIAVVLLTVFKSQSPVTNRVSGTMDSQITSTLLNRDVQGANYVTTQSTPACGSLGSQVLGLRSQGNQIYVSYVVVANGVNSNYSLFRQLCTGGVVSTPASSTLVSDNVPSSQTASVTCASTIACTTAANWIATAGVSSISLSVSETTTGAIFAMTSVPRAWNSASAGLAADPFPVAPLDLLGGGSCPQTVLTMTGGAYISIGGGAGPFRDESSCSPSVSLSGSVSIFASSFATADTTPASTVTIVKQGASYPAPVYASPNGDPLASLLTAPTTPTTGLTGSCPASGVSGTCTPGNFSSAITINGSSSVTFSTGTYVFNQPVTVSNGGSATFGSGNYIFNAGLTVSGSSPVVFDTGTYIFAGTSSSTNALSVGGSGSISSGPGGVLFYIKQGIVAFSGAGNVALSGLEQYYGVSLWQAASDTNNITLQGSSAINAAYGGIYAPSGTIYPSGSSVMSASYVIAKAAYFTGSSGLNVG